MGWSFPIGAVKGTVIRVHFTFILFLVWIGAASYARGGSDAAVQAVLFMILLFLLRSSARVWPCICSASVWRADR